MRGTAPLTSHPTAVPTTDTCDLVCLNGGSCFLNARKQAKCRCQPRYNGERCQINQCSDYCQNGGLCTASPSGEPLGVGWGVWGGYAERGSDGSHSQVCPPAAAPPASRGPGVTSRCAPTTATTTAAAR